MSLGSLLGIVCFLQSVELSARFKTSAMSYKCIEGSVERKSVRRLVCIGRAVSKSCGQHQHKASLGAGIPIHWLTTPDFLHRKAWPFGFSI